MNKKIYQTDTFKFAIGIAVGILIYEIVNRIFFQSNEELMAFQAARSLIQLINQLIHIEPLGNVQDLEFYLTLILKFFSLAIFKFLVNILRNTELTKFYSDFNFLTLMRKPSLIDK